MAGVWKRTNPLALAVLVLLFERAMHPYEMAATLRERDKEASIKINYGSLYTVIALLERAGFIAARATVRDSRRPERTIYTLTPAGHTEIRDWMRALLSTPVKEYPQFEAALALIAAIPPDEAVAYLEERVRRLGEETRDLRAKIAAALEMGVARLYLIEADYHLTLREAERGWVAGLVREIATEAWDSVREWRQWHHDETTREEGSDVSATETH